MGVILDSSEIITLERYRGIVENLVAGRETQLNTSLAALVSTLEALLIEALEPPQNRKRGDDFSR